MGCQAVSSEKLQVQAPKRSWTSALGVRTLRGLCPERAQWGSLPAGASSFIGSCETILATSVGGRGSHSSGCEGVSWPLKKEQDGKSSKPFRGLLKRCLHIFSFGRKPTINSREQQFMYSAKPGLRAEDPPSPRPPEGDRICHVNGCAYY